jgi:hypothetical protein
MKALRLRGYFVFKVHGGPTMMSGLPDMIVCVNGKYVGLETKMPDKRANVSVVQRLIHGKIKAAGGVAEVVCSPHEALRVCARVASE